MDDNRFDDLARDLALRPTRRAFLGAMLAGTAGALDWRVGPIAAAPKPKPCLPEGKKSKDPGRCCSKATADGRCCGVEGGSCAVTGCCDPVSVTPICHDGECVVCLLEGTPSEDPDVCCSKSAAGGLCCGEVNGSCTISGCCSGNNSFCVGGSCVGCLPEGHPSANANDCCSLTLGDGVCCGIGGGSCAQSGCCPEPDYVCDNGTCVPCLPEGAPSTDPARCCGKTVSGGVCRAEGCLPDGAATTDPSLCCSLLWANGVCAPCYPEGVFSGSPLDCCSETTTDDGTCCGEAGGSCEVTGCCAPGFDCCNGSCFAACPPPMTHNDETCFCETPCLANGATCTADAECCGGGCCNSVCVDTQTNRSHCGGCGNVCPGGLAVVCRGGACGSPCGDLFCPPGNFCAMAGGAPIPAACCPPGPAGTPYPYQCGDGVCCWAATPSYICNNFHSPCSPP